MDVAMVLVGPLWPCLLACVAVFNWSIAIHGVCLCICIAVGWWARGRFGGPTVTKSATADVVAELLGEERRLRRVVVLHGADEVLPGLLRAFLAQRVFRQAYMLTRRARSSRPKMAHEMSAAVQS